MLVEYLNKLAKDQLKFPTEELAHYPPGWLMKGWFVLESECFYTG